MSTVLTRVLSRATHVVGSLVSRVRSRLGGSSPAGAGRSASGWLSVTVLTEPAALEGAALPAPLAELGDRIDVRLRPAPGDRGTELSARLRSGAPRGSAGSRLSGSDPEADLRSALRRAKQLLEVGEVLAVDPAPHGRRSATPGGTLLESWTKAAPKAGVR
ncbi:hypothetical protein [Aeromicrobium sp. IC_218]|uniref:hypothetical protein n=1 Tax=Aeromicrobium sp. IC_218 TaxID=2545468 RepID=UPI0010387536|nr:hypothetical protein [Aeromicrobium sp. IC_218]TCI99695.1 hypothetical protein E0W78_04595 [Aeromicrobium sp. IC_218]